VSRNTQSKGISGGTSTVWALPLRRNCTAIKSLRIRWVSVRLPESPFYR
jgi:hypothetical protein